MNVKHFELVNEAKGFLNTHFGLDLSVPIEFNTRMKRCLGRFLFSKKLGENVPLKIEMSVDFMQSHPREHIYDVLKHELVHYALCVMKRPFDDGHPVFEGELRKLGIKSTHSYQVAGSVHKYVCERCGKEYERKTRLNKFARCGCSIHSNLNYLGIVNLEAR
ncbi:MAG TPA: SprT-like domain-containing protein [Pseudoneobacillus sp.]|nr:SprT-like domain-containing protein [Pseudoneobacillus sp.]